MMKRLTIYLLLLLSVICARQSAAQNPYEGQVLYENYHVNRLLQNGEISKIEMRYTVDLSKVKLKSTQQIRITPILRSSDKRDSLLLDSYWVVGANRYRAIRRAVELGSDTTYCMDRVLKRKNKEPQTIEIKGIIDYRPWMHSANFSVVEEVTGCAGCNDGTYISQLVSKLFPDPYQPRLVAEYVKPKVEAVKHRAESLEAFFNYKQGKHDLLVDYKGNAGEIARVDKFVKSILGDSNLQVSDFKIDGYASPEGRFESNITLSKNRAYTFASFLKNTYGISDSKMKIDWHGEDWDGLKNLVETSSLEYKEEILNIIDTKETDLQREAAINKLDKGKTLNHLLEDYYPRLRRNVASVSYVVKAFDLQEAKEVYHRKPSQLSLDELFQVANSFEKGSEDFAQVFRVAHNLFPADPIANLNCGAAEIEAGRPAEALNYLMKAQDLPEALNNIGCALAMQRKYDQAEVYFDRAIAAGNRQAVLNKEENRKAAETAVR
ncbi:DUF3868 domain-containing protein [Porphyromonas crevioricanis]|nr:DUF3868 domain-containing protein [Porphyromonas crevioricanis]GAD07380.1 hypothetical protein PORCAN_1000 [Porphyromonas crevioricanis JCM 13913]